MKKYSFDKEIEALRLELSAISEISSTVNTKGWGHIRRIFEREIQGYVQDVYDLCGKYGKYEFEIKVKKHVGDSLGRILAVIDGRVANKQQLTERLETKAQIYADEIDRRRLQNI